MRLPVSSFIISQDEVHCIGAAIRSVREWVDEVVVVDSGSKDGTDAIARTEGAQVIHHPWPGFGQQKRFAEEQCRNDWLLNLDADEVVTPELAAEIQSLFDCGEAPKAAAYGMSVHIVYPGRRRPRAWARDHYCLRLYDRRRVRFRDSTLHDRVDSGMHVVGHLRQVIHHHAFASLGQLARKCDKRAYYSAAHATPRPLWLLAARFMTELPMQFFKYYLLRRHVAGGWMGAQVAAILAYYRWVRIVRMYRNQRSSGVRMAVNDHNRQ